MTGAWTGRGSGADGVRQAEQLLVPISLELAAIRQLLVIDVDNDPTYRVLEPQVIEQSDGRCGLVLLAYRHDDQMELYADAAAEVDAAGYHGLGHGLIDIHRTGFAPARFEVTTSGLKCDIAFNAPNGRSIELHLHEHLARGGETTSPPWLPSVARSPPRTSSRSCGCRACPSCRCGDRGERPDRR